LYNGSLFYYEISTEYAEAGYGANQKGSVN